MKLLTVLILALALPAMADCPLRPNTYYGYIDRIKMYATPKTQRCAPKAIGYVLMDRVDADFSLGILWNVPLKMNQRVQLTEQTRYWRCTNEGRNCLSASLEAMPRSGKSGAYIAKYGNKYVAEKFWSYE